MTIVPGSTAVKTLFALSGNTCYYDGCENRLTDPAWRRVRARVAHISGEHEGSARYDASMSDDERAAFENLMLLCPNCHTLIDDLEPDRHTIAVLRAMKARHEASAQNKPHWQPTEADLVAFADTLIVMFRERYGIQPSQRRVDLEAEQRQRPVLRREVGLPDDQTIHPESLAVDLDFGDVEVSNVATGTKAREAMRQEDGSFDGASAEGTRIGPLDEAIANAADATVQVADDHFTDARGEPFKFGESDL